MGAATLISVEEYLHTNYDPDREYVDGEVVERNLGEKTHSTIQANLIVYFAGRRKEWGVQAYPEQRVQVSPTRFRIPDVTVIKLSQEQGEIFTRRTSASRSFLKTTPCSTCSRRSTTI